MRGADYRNDGLFSSVQPDSQLPANPLLRAIRFIVALALRSLSLRFEAMYSAIIDGGTTRRPGFGVSQIIRKRIEKANGWIKFVAGSGA